MVRVDGMRTPKGHIRRRGGSYEISVPVGRDPVTKRYRYVYDYAQDEEAAERKRDELIARHQRLQAAGLG